MSKSALKKSIGISSVLYNKIQNDIIEVVELIQNEYPYEIPLMESVKYALDIKGKMKRPLLLYLCFLCLKKDLDDNLKFISTSIEFIHTASLIHDDIIDGGLVRRNKDSVFKKFGIPTSILAGDFLIFLSTKMISNISDKYGNALSILSCMNKTYCDMCLGQTLEESLIGNLHIEVEKYSEVIKLKTAVFFECICKVAGLLAGASEFEINQLGSYGINLGMAYQIRDDVLGFMDDCSNMGKSNYLDAERKLVTLPIILAYKNANESQSDILKHNYLLHNHGNIISLKKTLYDTDAINKTIDIINNYIKKACDALDSFDNTEAKTELIQVAKSLSLGGY